MSVQVQSELIVKKMCENKTEKQLKDFPPPSK